MKKKNILRAGRSLVLAGMLLMPVAAVAADTYAFDKGHTDIRFSWNHAGISTQFARLTKFDGTFVIDDEDISKSSVDVTFDADSIRTSISLFDGHLASDKWFDAAKFPKITYKSTAVRQTGKHTLEIQGNLTIKGISKPVTLEAEVKHFGLHPLGAFVSFYKGAKYATFAIKGQLLRSEFGLGRAAPLNSDRITIEINTELRKQ